MKKQILIPIFLAAAGFIALLSLAGCEKLSLEGTHMDNLSPQMFWPEIPQYGTQHSFNPVIKWYGKDLDGQIVNYEFTILLADYVETLGGPDAVVEDFPADAIWDSLGNITSAVIPLVASEDTTDDGEPVYIEQFLFMRCLDDAGAYSVPIYLLLSRNNHPPTCTVSVPEGPQWCLPDTTGMWSGITISWEGKDSLDYPEIQPDFLWEVKIYGPFDSEPDPENPDTSAETFLGKLVENESGVDLVEEVNPATDDSLLASESVLLVDTLLVAKTDGFGADWYIIYVRNFDDAFVSSVPALGFLQVYIPRWINNPDEAKDVLVINSSYFHPGMPGIYSAVWRDSVANFYSDLISGAGIPPDKWDWTDDTAPTIAVLYMYRLVIIDDIDWNGEVSPPAQEPLTDYLDIGGNLWVIGRMSFMNTANYEGRYEYGPNSTTEPIPYTYLDLTAAYFPNASFVDAELVGGMALASGFPDLEIDTVKTQALNEVVEGSFDHALPRVEYLIRMANSEPLYLFEAISPDTSRFHNFPIAVRHETSTFKASYFSFPLFFVSFDDALVVADSMFTWFLGEDY